MVLKHFFTCDLLPLVENCGYGTENEILVQALPILEKEILIPKHYTFCNHTFVGFHI